MAVSVVKKKRATFVPTTCQVLPQ